MKIQRNYPLIFTFVLAFAAFINSLLLNASFAFGASGRQEQVTAAAATNPTFNYQGDLRNPDGNQAPNGEYTLNLRFYDAVIGGNKLHEEIKSKVAVRDGRFSVVLGDTVPLPPNLFATSPRYLGISVNGEQEMLPRQQIRPVPWALQANNAKVAELANNATNASHAEVASVANTLPPTGIIPGQPSFQNVSFQGLCFGCGRTAIFAKNVGNTVLQKGTGVALKDFEFNDFQEGPLPTVTAGGAYGFVIGRASLQESNVNGTNMKSLVASSDPANPGDYVGIQTAGIRLARVCSPYPRLGPQYTLLPGVTSNSPLAVQPGTGCVVHSPPFIAEEACGEGNCVPRYPIDQGLVWMWVTVGKAILNPDPATGFVWIQ